VCITCTSYIILIALQEIELLRQEVANKDIIIAKIGEKTIEWEERFLKLKQEQHNELRAI
jgi:3-polyprenyl-4-hydroxybenzoate decarboxylase